MAVILIAVIGFRRLCMHPRTMPASLNSSRDILKEAVMIFGNLQNLEQDRKNLPKAVLKGLDYIRNTDLSTRPAGRYEIEGSDIFALVQDNLTAPKTERKAETHRKYIDIQYVHSGLEIIGYGLANSENEVLDDQSEQKDAIFYKNVRDEMDLVLTAGMYTVLFPTDVHRPGCVYGAPTPVRKVVIKVAVHS